MSGIDLYDIEDVNPLALLASFLHTIAVTFAIGNYINTIIRANFAKGTNPAVYHLTANIPNFYTISYVMGALFIDLLMTIRQIMPHSFCKEFSSAFSFTLGVTSGSYLCRAGVLFFLSCEPGSKYMQKKRRTNQALSMIWFLNFAFHGSLAVDSYVNDTPDLCTNLFGRVPVGILFGLYGFYCVIAMGFTFPLLYFQTSYFMEAIITLILYSAFAGSTLIVVAKYLPANGPALLSVFLNWTVFAVIVNIIQIYWKRWPAEILQYFHWFCRCIPLTYSQLEQIEENKDEARTLVMGTILDIAEEFGEGEDERHDLEQTLYSKKDYYSKDILFNVVFSKNIWAEVTLPSNEEELIFDKGKKKDFVLSNLQTLSFETPKINTENIQQMLLTLDKIQEYTNTQNPGLVSLLLFWRRILYIIINPKDYHTNLPILQSHKNSLSTLYNDIEAVWSPLTTTTNQVALTQQLKGVCAYLGQKIEYLLRDIENKL